MARCSSPVVLGSLVAMLFVNFWNVDGKSWFLMCMSLANLNERRWGVSPQSKGTSTQRISSGSDGIVRCCCAFGRPSLRTPIHSGAEKTMFINVEGTENVLQCALDAGISKVVVASSAAVYGSWPEMPLLESAPVECLSPYAESKAANEKQVVAFRNKGLNAIALRFFNVYGPGQRYDSAYASLIPLFVHSMKNGKRPTIHGTGEQTQDFVHVHDLAKAVHAMVKRSNPYEYSVANVASQTQISVLDVVQSINQCLNERKKMEAIVPLHGDVREGDVMHSCGSNKRIQEMIDWMPKSVLPKALHRCSMTKMRGDEDERCLGDRASLERHVYDHHRCTHSWIGQSWT